MKSLYTYHKFNPELSICAVKKQAQVLNEKHRLYSFFLASKIIFSMHMLLLLLLLSHYSRV